MVDEPVDDDMPGGGTDGGNLAGPQPEAGDIGDGSDLGVNPADYIAGIDLGLIGTLHVPHIPKMLVTIFSAVILFLFYGPTLLLEYLGDLVATLIVTPIEELAELGVAFWNAPEQALLDAAAIAGEAFSSPATLESFVVAVIAAGAFLIFTDWLITNLGFGGDPSDD